MNLIVLAILLALNTLLLVFLLVRSGAKAQPLDGKFESLDKAIDKLYQVIRDDFSKNREESGASARQLRGEVVDSLKSVSGLILQQMKEFASLQKSQLETFSNQLVNLTQMNEQKMENMRVAIEQKLKMIQDDNAQKLEQMRMTVDEKLHSTLEKRLGESFKIVSDRLEKVSQGLGEMQALASDVGGLKRVLTNVKTRGTWGEIQLGNLLDEIFTHEQYATNVCTRPGSRENVEFAIKLPGKNDQAVWLPVDAKFPREDYEKLVEAQEKADPVLVEELGKALEARIKLEARNIKEKYIEPPHTTDFGILYLPTEGLYAEVIRRPGLYDQLRREFRVAVTGPTTILAFLNSLQMGFRTLAIEKRASEVWNLLSTVKAEFNKFGIILERANKQLETVTTTISLAATKTRTIEKKLKDVQGIPGAESSALLSDLASAQDAEDIVSPEDQG